MAQANTAVANTNTPLISRQRNWPAIVCSSLVGGVIVFVAAPAIAALMPIGAIGFAAGTTTTGVLGSVMTRLVSNQTNGDCQIFSINRYLIQQHYRKTFMTYVETVMQPIFKAIQTNTASGGTDVQTCRLEDIFLIQGLDAKERNHTMFRLRHHVIPKKGPRRNIAKSIPPAALPTYARNATRQVKIGSSQSSLEGVDQIVVEGALFGALGGALLKEIPVLGGSIIIPTVPGKIGVIVGMSSATGTAGSLDNITFPSTGVDKMTFWIEFATELQCHFHRLVECAINNGVVLEVTMEMGCALGFNAAVPHAGTVGGYTQLFYWGDKR
ncbi:hypothetical protein BU24DRAFT_420567 [Aaosphaeria arxii CBS 175.79]|uniref:Uncharacterized protein n=1 Tax=Aaosphaeria arxii CBS 175.79 TaxID=1450172 RepID=A0A6A5XX50_9PLEO|nr:uncharacterized protein BU24DRAFT_420567 [Aaosphaeria arxii CBS 175.79]KAF2017539.1 hypothetical protein BU24DRAFT_420567 [Aaosphaeria arxii CBS 175.79]